MMSQRALGELVTFRNPNGLHLDGIRYASEQNTKTIIHVHGSYGNFYQNAFIRHMARAYQDAGMNLLSFNLSSHDGICEAYRNIDDFEYAGGAIREFSDCSVDIRGAVDFAAQFSDEIVLQGHSLGCDRVLFYLIDTNSKHDLVLLSPCDSYQLQTNWLRKESVESQIHRLRNQATHVEWEWLPIEEYGIRQGEWEYGIPITRHVLLSILEGPAFAQLRMSKPMDFHLDQKAIVYIGGKDVMQTTAPDKMFSYLEQRIARVSRAYFPEGDHSMDNCEDRAIMAIVEWLKRY